MKISLRMPAKALTPLRAVPVIFTTKAIRSSVANDSLIILRKSAFRMNLYSVINTSPTLKIPNKMIVH